jgi:hypothetical protein
MVRPSHVSRSPDRQLLFHIVIAAGLAAAAACGDDSSAPVDAGANPADAGGLGCPELFDCVAACADDDDPCVTACIESGTEEAVARANDLAVCAQSAGCSDEACLSANCAPQVLACAGAEPPPDAGVACDGVGFPELTGPLTGLAPSYTGGDEITVSVPYDADTGYVRLAVYDYATSTTLIQNWAETTTTSPASAMIGLPTVVAPGHLLSDRRPLLDG